MSTLLFYGVNKYSEILAKKGMTVAEVVRWALLEEKS